MVSAMKPIEFLDKYYPMAVENEKKYRIPALLTLSQAALESGWGEHAPGNNFFGIKCAKDYTGPSQILQTKEYKHGKLVTENARFMKYESPSECFEDHAEFLIRNFPYAIGNANPVQFAELLQSKSKHLYATDIKYVSKISMLVTTFKHFLTEQALNGQNKV